MKSIKAKFLTFILPAVTIGFVSLAAILTALSITKLEEQSLENIQSANDYLQKNINNWLSFQMGVIGSIGDMTPALTADNKVLESINNNLDYRNIAVVDAKGIAKMAGNPERIGADYSNLDYINAAQQSTGQTIISDVRFSRVDGTPLISFAKTLPGGDTVFTSAPLENLYQDYVNINRDHEFNYSFILTSNCEPLAHPLIEKGTSATLNYSSLCSDSNIIKFNENGESYVAYVSKHEKTRWFIVTAVNEKKVAIMINKVIKTSIIVCLLALLMIVLTLLFLTGSVSKSLNKIVAMLDIASSGDIDKLSQQKTELEHLSKQSDEVGRIANATRMLVVSQEKKVAFAKAIANGDLSENLDVSPADVLGKALNLMSQRLKMLIDQLISVVEEVDNTSNHLAGRSNDLQNGVVNQRSAVKDIARRIATLKEHINEQGRLVDNINDKAVNACQEAEDSKSQMQEMINSLQKIHESGENISGIMGNIVDIAGQTNLIALNAAIEAARAGEHGRGFAVVADEVRNLAGRSGSAATKTSALVNTSLDAISAGKNATSKTEHAFLTIASHVSNLSECLETIKEFSTEQVSTMQSLSTDLHTVENITEINNTLSDNLSGQCASLKKLTDRLQNEIHKFKL